MTLMLISTLHIYYQEETHKVKEGSRIRWLLQAALLCIPLDVKWGWLPAGSRSQVIKQATANARRSRNQYPTIGNDKKRSDITISEYISGSKIKETGQLAVHHPSAQVLHMWS